MKIKSLAAIFFAAFLLPVISKAQDIEMADPLRANGKIYIVVIVLTIILAGLFLFLMSIDYRLKKLERNPGKSHIAASNQRHVKDKV